jgi:histidinol-phosphate aminotransferase
METLAPRPGVAQIKAYRPPRPPFDDGRAWIDLSMTVNPLGAGAKAVSAYRHAACLINRYPDPENISLRQALAQRYDLDVERTTCGAGSDELIHLVCQAFAGPGDEVLTHEYAYRGFMKAIRAAGATPVIAAERDLAVDVDALIDRAGDKTKICFLANPNNPTGGYIPTDAVRRLRAGLPPGVLLVLDSAYADYCRRQNYSDGLELVENADNVVVLRTLSKMHGLAGLRVGWAYGPAPVIRAINQVRGPFNVAAPAQLAAVAALSDQAHEETSLRHNGEWLPWLTDELSQLGLRVYPSVCNFVLARAPVDPDMGVVRVLDHLHRHGVLVKSAVGYGLPDCLRVAVGREDDNLTLVKVLRELADG